MVLLIDLFMGYLLTQSVT